MTPAEFRRNTHLAVRDQYPHEKYYAFIVIRDDPYYSNYSYEYGFSTAVLIIDIHRSRVNDPLLSIEEIKQQRKLERRSWPSRLYRRYDPTRTGCLRDMDEVVSPDDWYQGELFHRRTIDVMVSHLDSYNKSHYERHIAQAGQDTFSKEKPFRVAIALTPDTAFGKYCATFDEAFEQAYRLENGGRVDLYVERNEHLFVPCRIEW